MTRSQKFIIILPLVYSCLLSLLIFFQGSLFYTEVKNLLAQTSFQFLGSTFLLLIPNILLSFFILGYIRAHPTEEKNPLILCISSLTIATLMSCSIWIFFYKTIAHIPIIVYGFPVTYFFGMCIGYVVGIVGLGLGKGSKD